MDGECKMVVRETQEEPDWGGERREMDEAGEEDWLPSPPVLLKDHVWGLKWCVGIDRDGRDIWEDEQ